MERGWTTIRVLTLRPSLVIYHASCRVCEGWAVSLQPRDHQCIRSN